MANYVPAILYLSSEGNSFETKRIESGTIRTVDFDKDEVHPLLQHAATCKSYQAVLDFLDSLTEQEDILKHVKLMHKHNFAYKGHCGALQGAAHPESIESMKMFVRKRMEDLEENTSPYAYSGLVAQACVLL